MTYPDEVEFTVTCRMRPQWASAFKSMLNYMEQLGDLGASRHVTLFADGDGDFRPRFEFDRKHAPDAKISPVRDDNGDRVYDRAPGNH